MAIPKKKAITIGGCVASVVAAAFVIYSVVITGNLPITVKKVVDIEEGQTISFKHTAGTLNKAIEAEIDFSVLTNIVEGIDEKVDCWIVIAGKEEAPINE